ncbi:MAG: hypothetical protein AAB518_03680 [Patescibacteria group bacterium]
MTEERWHTLTKRVQLLSIGAELERARVWESKKEAQFRGAIERALGLIDLTIGDPKWRGESLRLIVLRDAVAAHYAGVAKESIKKVYEAL